MMTTTVESRVAKRNDVSVKMDLEAVQQARIASAILGKTLAEYLSDVVRIQADKDVAEFKTTGATPKSKGPKR